MSQKFLFEELDDSTRDYLIAVRDNEGSGAPGVFVPSSSSLAGCGLILGPILILVTLLLTLTTWINVIYHDPVRVALLQTAGLLLGGWLILAGVRAAMSKGSNKIAGHWVYVDPLHMYEAYREQITVTPIEDAVEANFTHNYNNGNYQNSAIRVLLSGNKVAQVTVNNEQRAEQMVIYLNYLAWARGEGGDRAALPPASLGGLAKYVSKHDAEPKDAEGNINLNLIELDVTEVPEAPTREGRAMPSLLPYVFIVGGGFAIFALMAYVVNPPRRDDAIYETVTKVTNPPSIEPRFLRAYLIDERNKRHRPEVLSLLSGFYDPAVVHVSNHAGDVKLKDGMIKILESLRTAEQPVVSLRVTEKPTGKAGAGDRQNKLREAIVGGAPLTGPNDLGGILDEFAKMPGGAAISPEPGVIFAEKPPPIGHQLIAFVEAPEPEEAEHAHFEIEYELKQLGKSDKYEVECRVTLRTDVKGDEVATYSYLFPGMYTLEQLDQNMFLIRDRIVQDLVGRN